MNKLKEERQYERLRKLGQELHIPIPEAFIKLEVFDKDGKLIQRHRQRSHSWTRNAYNMMFSCLASKNCTDATFEAGKLSMKDTSGVKRSGNYPWSLEDDKTQESLTCGYRAGGGDDDHGILVGSGTTAESFEDYKLETQITEGTGAGQLNHAISEAHVVTWTPATKILKDELVRYFNNNTVGETSVDVNEVGLHRAGNAFAQPYDACMAHDKLASTVTVPSTGQLKVTYTIQLTYPE